MGVDKGGQRSILRRAEILATVCLSRLNQSKLRLSPSVIKLPVSRTMSDGEKGCYSGQSYEETKAKVVFKKFEQKTAGKIR